jgi:hypothetical protein
MYIGRGILQPDGPLPDARPRFLTSRHENLTTPARQHLLNDGVADVRRGVNPDSVFLELIFVGFDDACTMPAWVDGSELNTMAVRVHVS